ncbi:hypothetical protein ACEWY4_017593 [Coilia grayii]|uniref:HTH psq-type domain-containing protein n=1 Tax=Coilia grayii TaxID=363190 RepID=A0ABD1JHJ2_9TELE
MLRKKKAVAEGFRKCGVYPLNPNAVDYSHVAQSSPDEPSTESTDNLLTYEEMMCSYSLMSSSKTPEEGEEVRSWNPGESDVLSGDNKQKKKRMKWRNEDMLSALQKVKGGMTMREACRTYNVPRATLRDRVSGRVVHGTLSDPETLLSANEEEELLEYCRYCAKHGFRVYQATVAAAGAAVFKCRKSWRKESRPLGRQWWLGFAKKKPCRAGDHFRVP